MRLLGFGRIFGWFTCEIPTCVQHELLSNRVCIEWALLGRDRWIASGRFRDVNGFRFYDYPEVPTRVVSGSIPVWVHSGPGTGTKTIYGMGLDLGPDLGRE